MSYIVLMRFADLQDDNRIYEAGAKYPRPGFDVTPERLAELAGSDNRVGRPLIRPLIARTVKAPKTPVEAPDVPDKEIPAKGAEAPKGARRARKKG